MSSSIFIKLRERVDRHFRSEISTPMNELCKLALSEAIAAGIDGNYPVGAVVADENFKPVSKGRNSVFTPRFRSEAHAEMNAISQFEAIEDHVEMQNQFILVSTLEPCLMCASRVMLSKIAKVHFLLPDPTASISSALSHFPPHYRELAARIQFAEISVNLEIRSIAEELYRIGEERWTSGYSLTT